MAGEQSENFTFGDFEVDLRLGELRRQGQKVPLQEQPFQVLAVLLQHPGELVRREEVRRQIWAEDTFVAFDHALNTDVKKIRIALGDCADCPTYVETIPKRGYRFIADVRVKTDSLATLDQAFFNSAPGESRTPTAKHALLLCLFLLASLVALLGWLSLIHI